MIAGSRYLTWLALPVFAAICVVGGKVGRAAISPVARPSAFSFSLTRTANVSAGIFTPGGSLVRLICANERLEPGRYRRQWDGRDDHGEPAPAGQYVAKAVSHNLNIRWEGTIGNSSTDRTGTSTFRGFGGLLDMLTLGDYEYLLRDYNEVGERILRFRRDDPGRYYPSGLQSVGFTPQSPALGYLPASFATDGHLIYVGMTPNPARFRGPGNNFVLAYDPEAPPASADLTFSGVAPIKGVNPGENNGGKWIVLNRPEQVSATIPNALAVQQRGSALAVAMHAGGEVVFYDKRAGSTLPWPKLEAPGVSAIKWSPDERTIWTADEASNSIQGWRLEANAWKCEVTIHPGDNVAGLAVRPSDGSLAVLVAGGIQQVRFYSSDGSPGPTLGAMGGYAQTPRVENDRFAFLPEVAATPRFDALSPLCIGGIAFAPDESFWVMDKGDCRLLDFTSDRHCRRALSYIPGMDYTQATDSADPTRVFAGYLEFARNYAVSLVHHSDGSDGAWRLVRNWSSLNLGDGRSEMLLGSRPRSASWDGLIQVVTSRSGPTQGRTFAMLLSGLRRRYDFVELDEAQGMTYRASFDSAVRPGSPSFCPPSGFDSVTWLSLLSDVTGVRVMAAHVDDRDKRETIFEQVLEGIVDGRAQWTPPRPYASDSYTAPDQLPYRGPAPMGGGIELLSDGSLVTTDDSGQEGSPFIGILPKGGTSVTNRFALGAFNMPLRRDGTVPIAYPGPWSSYPSGGVRTAGDMIVQFDHGEGVDMAEINQILFFHRSGLPLGQTGQRSRGGPMTMAATSGAGGNFNAHYVNALPSGDLVIHVNSESMQGGIGEIWVRNVRSIREIGHDFSSGATVDLGDVSPGGEPSPTDSEAAERRPIAFIDSFRRPDGATVGNGWVDEGGHFELRNGELRVRSGGPGLSGFLARGTTPRLSTMQTIHIPARLCDPTRVVRHGGGEALDVGLVGRQIEDAKRAVADRETYYADVYYIKFDTDASAPKARYTNWARRNGYFWITIAERHHITGVGTDDYLLACDNWYELPDCPGHSYTFTFTVTGSSPTILDACLQDDMTGQKSVLHAENDEPSLQGPGRVGILGRRADTAVAGGDEVPAYTLR